MLGFHVNNMFTSVYGQTCGCEATKQTAEPNIRPGAGLQRAVNTPEDAFPSNNTVWANTQPAQRHLSFIHKHRKKSSLFGLTDWKGAEGWIFKTNVRRKTSTVNCTGKTADSARRLQRYNNASVD